MTKIKIFFPLFADAISGAFGGAMLGSRIGGDTVTIIAAVTGAIIILSYGMKQQFRKNNFA